ncbi:MAG: NUDIX domain-containing protein [Bradyrhizobiaceae bacterium]|nr:MAG: NUDIX domain-containing protein [Bradyrhizobiaceae bacterium]
MNGVSDAGADRAQHPYRRPRDAAALILIDRSGRVPKILVGKRHHGLVFMPGRLVFPGGRVDPTDNRIPLASALPKALEKRLQDGSPKIEAARARALVTAAIREVCEETGLCLGRKVTSKVEAAQAMRLSGAWTPFAEAGLLPDPSQLYLIARAITPPGNIRRYDARFFTAEASAIAHEVKGIVHADAELVELVWIELGAPPLADMHPITRRVLAELEKRLEAGPLSHRHPELPFFHYRAGAMQRDVI